MEETAAALLALLAVEDGMSIHKACKKLGISMSEMMRLLSTLAPMDLVGQQAERGRNCLYLTAAGRALCAATVGRVDGQLA